MFAKIWGLFFTTQLILSQKNYKSMELFGICLINSKANPV